MLAKSIGPGLVMVFCLSQAFRDVYFANAFQGVDFFVIILLAFSIATLAFGAVAVLRRPSEFAQMRSEVPAFIWMNVLTAVAWTSYFFSLKYLQPSIVNTLHSGAGPLTVVVMAAFGIHIARPSPMRRVEYICFLGIAASLLFLWWVVLAERSGLQSEDLVVTLAGLVLPIVSGVSITISSLWAKRMNERGIGADAVTAARYILIVTIALIAVVAGKRPAGIATSGEFTVLALATTILIVLPIYSLQVGIARTAPLTAHTIRSLGPALVFGLELVDGRIAYSGPALLGIALYSFFALGSNLVRGWQGATIQEIPAPANRNGLPAPQPCAKSQ